MSKQPIGGRCNRSAADERVDGKVQHPPDHALGRKVHGGRQARHHSLKPSVRVVDARVADGRVDEERAQPLFARDGRQNDERHGDVGERPPLGDPRPGKRADVASDQACHVHPEHGDPVAHRAELGAGAERLQHGLSRPGTQDHERPDAVPRGHDRIGRRGTSRSPVDGIRGVASHAADAAVVTPHPVHCQGPALKDPGHEHTAGSTGGPG